ncbi:sigma-70 family RNA polymerase sigma factor [Streptomyces sp. NPDC056527]|uniref:sigma-70 family RNA polymerase sigma factor n=1 Tax=Streptomyces sp. NPDC056527 TaxID=3345853 RepID=UPI0036AB9167
MTGADDTLTEEQAERMLAAMNEVIRAGEEMRQLRAEMIQLFAGLGWTQDRIARIADMSQPAVSKQVAKHKPADPPRAPMELSLDQRDVPWLEGRLWGLAEEIAESCDAARCARHVEAIARGKKRFTPRDVDELRRSVEEDLRRHRERLPAAFRDAYDVISRGLDVPAKVIATGSPSARRTLAHRIQRDRLGDATRA